MIKSSSSRSSHFGESEIGIFRSREGDVSMRALLWGHLYGASSRAVTKDGKLPNYLGNLQLRPAGVMLSTSKYQAKLVGYPLASLGKKSAFEQSYSSYENNSGVVSQQLKGAKNGLYRAGLVLHDPKWSNSNQRHLSQSKKVLYCLRVRSLREALASGTSGWRSHTSEVHLVLGNQVQNQV